MGRLHITTAVALLLLGCADDVPPGTPTLPDGPLDPSLVVESARVRVGAPSAGGELIVVGLPGAAAAGETVALTDSAGALLAEAPRGPDGSFVLRAAVGQGTLALRALAGERLGPSRALTVPAAAGARPINPSLLAAPAGAGTVAARGVVGAAIAGAPVVLAVPETGAAVEVLADAGGNFAATLAASGGDTLLAFTAGDAPSVPVSRSVEAGDLPVLVSASGGPDRPLVALGVPAALGPGQPVTVENDDGLLASGSTGATGAFGLCFTGAMPGTMLAVGSATREVPEDPSLLALAPAFTIAETGGGLSVQGTAPAAMTQVIVVNCSTGQWTASPAGGEAALLLPGQGADVLAFVGVGISGAVGAAELVLAGTGEPIVAPLAGPDPSKLVHSAVVGGEVLVAGVAGAVPANARVRIGDTPTQATGDGAFAVRVPANTLDLVAVRLVAGPLESDPVVLPMVAPSLQSLPPVAGRITAVMDDGRALVRGPHRSGLVVVNPARGSAVVANAVGPRFQARLDASPGDRLYVFSAEPLGAPASSGWASRRAGTFDLPLLVSAPGPHACAVVPEGASPEIGVAAVAGSTTTPLSPVLHESGSLFAGFGGKATERIELSGPSGEAAREVPVARPLNLEGLSVTAHDGTIRLGSAGVDAGPEWLFALATAEGEVALVEPMQAAPWTLVTSLPPSVRVDVFAVHRPTGEASTCRRVEWDLQLDPPVVYGVTPWPLVLGGPIEVSGDFLQPGSTVEIGGVGQDLAGSSTLLNGTVASDTPLGSQTLTAMTPGGSTQVPVEVVAPPSIDEVTPAPLVAGKPALVTGSHFGAHPTVSLGGAPQVVASDSETALEVVVDPGTPVGILNLRVSNGFAHDSISVEVTCHPPVIASAPSPALLGESVTVTGDFLLGVAVTLGGVGQPLVEQSGEAVSFTVAPQTPLGPATLVVEGPCGETEAEVVVATDAPVITGTNPPLAVRGQPLNVQGDHLAGAEVTIGGVPQGLTIDSKKGLTLVVAGDTPLESQILRVQTPGGQAQTTVQVAAPPVVASFEPDPIIAGAPLTITGEHLTGAEVTLGGVALVLDESGPNSLAASVPSVVPSGPRDLVIVTPGGSTTAVALVVGKPLITQVLPEPANLGKPLLVAGDQLAGAEVTIGGVPQPVTGSDVSQVVIVVDEATSLGQQTLVVTTAGGTASAEITVVEGPLIDEVTPAPLVIGGPLVVTGSRFVPGATNLTVGGVIQPLADGTETTLSATVATGTPVGPQLLRVSTDDGTDDVEVTVLAPPKLNGALPDPVLAGQMLTLIGTGLAGATVSVAGLAAPVVEGGNTSVKVTVPSPTPPGLRQVEVTTPGGTASRQVGVLAPPPQLGWVSPDPVQAGALAVVSGKWLHDATVTIGGVSAPAVATAWEVVTVDVPVESPVGSGLTLSVTTPGGSAQVTVDVVAAPTGAPAISTVTPSSFAAGATVEVHGESLKGGVVTIAGVSQAVLSTSPGEITFVVHEDTPLGTWSLLVTTPSGQAAASVTVTPTPPDVTGVEPSPVAVGDLLTVTGTSLASFTSVTLGGVQQVQFFEVFDTKLVFRVVKGTPDGSAVELLVTGPGGSSVYPVDVLPKPPSPPTITSTTPAEVSPGDILTVYGAALDEATFTLGGVPHTSLPGGSGAQVKLEVSALVGPGLQPLVATNGDLPPAEVEVFVKPGPPLAGRIFLSAIGGGDAVLAAQPSAVAAGAIVNLTVGDDIATLTASATGSFAAVLSELGFTVEPGAVLRLEQIVDGGLSPPLELTLDLPATGAPPPPHPYLLRVEADGPDVVVYGPPPTFGAATTMMVAVAGDVSGVRKASQLHADPATGIVLPGSASAAVRVFAVVGDQSSAAVTTFAGTFDPPILASAVAGGVVCLAGLPGTATAKLAIELNHPDGAPAPTAAFTAASADTGSFAARAELYPVAGPGPFAWEGTVGPHTWSATAPTAGAPAPDVTLATEPGLVEVTAANLPADHLLLAATPSGAAAAGFGTVLLPTEDDVVFVWSVPLDGSPPSACSLHSL